MNWTPEQNPEDPPEHQRARPTLDYRPAAEDADREALRKGVVGCGGAVVLVWLAGFLIAITAVRGRIAAAILIGVAVALLVLSEVQYFNRQRRPYAIGIWIGIALSALIVGICAWQP